MLVAVPSEAPGGLEAKISEHFGHCPAFTLVQIDDGKVGEVTVLDNQSHDEGGCMAPVTLLEEKAVDALVAGGMGGRPLAGFQKVGITVYSSEDAGTVGEAVQLVADGKAREFDPTQTCGGGGGCGHDHGHEHHHHAPVVREPIEGKADVQKDRVVSIDYTLKDKKGTELDSSVDGEPLAYLHGHGGLVPGLEDELTGMEMGDQRIIEVAAADAYGDRDESKVTQVPLEELPPDPQIGAVLYARQPDGRMIGLTVVELSETHARLDLNHPLAGRDLVFDITIVRVEKATDEELAHGHVH